MGPTYEYLIEFVIVKQRQEWRCGSDALSALGFVRFGEESGSGGEGPSFPHLENFYIFLPHSRFRATILDRETSTARSRGRCPDQDVRHESLQNWQYQSNDIEEICQFGATTTTSRNEPARRQLCQNTLHMIIPRLASLPVCYPPSTMFRDYQPVHRSFLHIRALVDQRRETSWSMYVVG